MLSIICIALLHISTWALLACFASFPREPIIFFPFLSFSAGFRAVGSNQWFEIGFDFFFTWISEIDKKIRDMCKFAWFS